MNPTKSNPPAFPFFDEGCGMTMLDYFAAKAMQSLLNGKQLWVDDAARAQENVEIATQSYEMAAAMLGVRATLLVKQVEAELAQVEKKQ